MKRLFILLVLPLIFSNCSSSRLVDQYINPESSNFSPKKVLVVGLTSDIELQRQFEYSLVKALELEKVDAVKSVDYFAVPMDQLDQTEENLNNLKKQLLEEGFEAVLFSKLIGQESKVTIAQSYRNLNKSFESFNDYYTENRPVYGSSRVEDYPVYNTETSLYCLCPSKDRDLIWRGKIDIVDPSGVATTIRDYVKTVVKTLKKNNLLIVK